MTEIILATHNEHKVEEINAMMEGLPVHFVSLKEKHYNEVIPETGLTFDENAILKATTIGQYFGQLTLADDSGLEVDALQGAPGIYSARYAGVGATKDQLCQKLCQEMSKVPKEKRSARFRCVMALYDPKHDNCYTVSGVLEGRISDSMRGENGFGYDAVFEVPHLGLTLAEMKPETKNALSHRFRAVELVKERLYEYSFFK